MEALFGSVPRALLALPSDMRTSLLEMLVENEEALSAVLGENGRVDHNKLNVLIKHFTDDSVPPDGEDDSVLPAGDGRQGRTQSDYHSVASPTRAGRSQSSPYGEHFGGSKGRGNLVSVPDNEVLEPDRCGFCNLKGHSEDICRFKIRYLKEHGRLPTSSSDGNHKRAGKPKRLPPASVPCLFFNTKGCKNGDSCPYGHFERSTERVYRERLVEPVLDDVSNYGGKKRRQS